MKKLLNCPFCGGVDEDHKYDCYFVVVVFPLVNGEQPELSERAIAKAWNTRATDPLTEKMAEAATHLLANPDGVEEWQDMAIVIKEYQERKDAK